MPRVLKRIELVVPRRAAGYGGKTRGLAALARAGFPVPAAYAMPGWVADSFFTSVLDVADRPRALLRTPYVTDSRLRTIRERAREAKLPQDVVRSVSDALLAMREEGAVGFAVRSSATHEDQEGASAAGMHSTHLNLVREDEVLDGIKMCWSSLFQPRVLSYLRALGEDVPVSVGVVIQAMVPAEVSGVLFTCNPLTGDASEVVINAAYGLGSSVVDGRVTPDTYRVDKATGQLRDQVIGGKAQQTLLDLSGGVREVRVPPPERERAALSDHQLLNLRDLATRIEEHFGGNRDVEWAIVGQQVFVLQARPIVVPHTRGRRGSRREQARDRRKIVWSNANIGEALPGVATPFTWSVLSHFSDLGFRRAFGALGCTVPRDAELIGDFRGRIYINLTEFTSILSQIPWIHPSTLVRLGGGRYASELDEVVAHRSSTGFLLRLPQTLTRYVRENFRLHARITEFEEYFAEERARMSSVDPRLLEPSGLDRMLSDVEHLLDETGSIMLTAYANLLTAVLVLIGILRTFAPDESSGLYRDLLSGLQDVDSARPGFVLWRIAQLAKSDPAAAQRIREGDLSQLSVTSLPAGPTRDALHRFVEEFGHRGIREAEIAEPRWAEDPTLMFAALRSHLAGSLDLDQREEALARTRRKAEEKVEQSVPFALRLAVRRLLDAVRRFTRMRERLRGDVVEVLGMFRRVALEGSRRIQAREPEAGPEAAFFLSVAELRRVLHDDNERVAIRVQRRRLEYERNRALPDPPTTFVGFPPDDTASIPKSRRLRGLAASGGVAEGRARILRDPSQAAELTPGEILVVAAADTGWAPLFLAAAGVVTELGGPLSHAAIILREYAVPAVVNVANATQALQEGEWIRVDGDAGTVEILGA
ncbi:MAG: PEP-utilizing enzyme [Deltaproteobacteria bacterium]|nr:PEP-utilizing enzyme [Deltaproteobacteria bacterium]